MTITIEQMYEMQSELDTRIIKEKGLEGKDLLPNTFLALRVELGELANEWRGFKHWSNDQLPRNYCVHCQLSSLLHVCKNPLLEEYIDCLHFSLSIGLQLGFNIYQNKYIHDHNVQAYKSSHGITTQFNEVYKNICDIEENESDLEIYEDLLILLLSLGEMLGFTWDQIAAAYTEKNKINHERQANGY